MPGPASALYRMLIPAIVLLPTWFLGPAQTRLGWKTLAMIAAGGLFFALDLAFYNTSVLRTSAANATVFGNNSPIVVGLFTWIFFRRRPPVVFWLGLVLAIAGSLIIVWADLRHSASFGSGDLMATVAGACFAVYLMATERVRTTTSTLAFLRLAILSTALFLLLIDLGLGISLAVPRGPSWAALIGLGLISQLGGYLALTYALGHLPATATSISLLAQVPLTAILAAILLAEPVSTAQILGGALVLVGVVLANRQGRSGEEVNVTLRKAVGQE